MKKRWTLRVAIVCMAALIGLMMPSVSGLAAAEPEQLSSAASAPQVMHRDETVYGILKHDGAVESVFVVNHIRIPSDGVYIDSGDYEKVESLSHTLEPKVADGSVQWSLTKAMGDFYAKGWLKHAALPWVYEIGYSLDGQPVKGPELAGKTGKIEIKLTAKPNPNAHTFFKEHYAMQIQVPVNLENTRLIEAEGAMAVLTGRTNTLTYTLLPGTSGTFTILLDAEAFEMDSITAGLTLMDYDSSLDLGGMTEGFKTFDDGMGEMAEGTRTLKSGMETLSQGVAELAGGMKKLSGSGGDLIKGMAGYQSGLNQFTESLEPLRAGSQSVNGGLQALASQGATVLAGYQQLAGGISAQLPDAAEKAQLQYLAQSAQSSDPAAAQLGRMAQSLLEQMEGLEQLSMSLQTLNEGLIQYTGGVSQLSSQYKNLNTGLTELAGGAGGLDQGFEQLISGTRNYVGGADKISQGLSALQANTAALPGEVGKLLEGQLQMKDGLKEALTSIESLTGGTENQEKPVSFTDPVKGIAASVQFIIRTPAIRMVENKEEAASDTPVAKKGFVEKFLALFGIS